jgi:hypothetical protein
MICQIKQIARTVVPIPTLPVAGNVFCAAALIANAAMQIATAAILLCIVLIPFLADLHLGKLVGQLRQVFNAHIAS